MPGAPAAGLDFARVQTLSQIQETLAAHGLRPKRALGQNFLIDHNLLRRLVDASGVGEGDLVLEVGPGTGVLTDVLLERGCGVVAAELDDALAGLLVERYAGNERFELIHGDCLAKKTALSEALSERLAGRGFALVANLPYHAATPLMMTLLLEWPGCTGMFVTVQREVAERMAAGPADGKAYGQISVVTSWLARVERLGSLPPSCFWPRPEVTSAMVAVRRRPAPAFGVEVDPSRWPAVGSVVRELFMSRRKRLGGVLRRKGVDEGLCAECGVSADARIDSLPAGDIVPLAARLSESDAWARA